VPPPIVSLLTGDRLLPSSKFIDCRSDTQDHMRLWFHAGRCQAARSIKLQELEIERLEVAVQMSSAGRFVSLSLVGVGSIQNMLEFTTLDVRYILPFFVHTVKDWQKRIALIWRFRRRRCYCPVDLEWQTQRVADVDIYMRQAASSFFIKLPKI
jgi:hypothetical protein